MIKYTIHEIATRVLIDVDLFLCRDKSASWESIDLLMRYSARWWKFLKMGVSQIIKSVILYVVIASLFILLMKLFLNVLKIENVEIFTALLLFCEIAPIFLIVFALPSTYSDLNIPKDSTHLISKHLRDNFHFSTTKEVEHLKKIIVLFEENAKSRITSMKWIIGLIWAGFIYITPKYFDTSEWKNINHNEIILIFKYFANSFLVVITGYLLVWGYEAAIRRLFRCIEIGLIQTSFDIENPTSQQA